MIEGADLFLGLSAPGILTPEMVSGQMAENPIIMALANPTPEIMPDDEAEARSDAIDLHRPVGLSEPDQQRAVLPVHLPRRAGRRAPQINEPMKIACANALAELARKTSSAEAVAAYQGERMVFGRDYLIPKPFDPAAAWPWWPVAVARAAMETGVATREPTSADLDRQYRGSRADGSSRLSDADAPGLRGGALGQPADRLRRGRGRTRAAGAAVDDRGGHRPCRS